MCSSGFLNSAPDSGQWSISRPGRFTARKQPRYALNMKLGELHNRYVRFGAQFLAPTRIRTRFRPALSLVAI
jgi:hypothetical protein